jgi:RNA polymerase sigma-70 factor (ECF subfamily)
MLEENLSKLGRGDDCALEIIYNIMKGSVFALCFSILKNYSAAEDMMQDTFINVKKYILSYKTGTNGKAWILTICKNNCLNYIKKRKHEKLTDFQIDIKDDKELKAKDESGIITLTVNNLKKIDSRIVLLHTIGGLTLKEIAESENMSEGTVRWKYNNSLKKLKKLLEKEGKNEY